MRLTQAEKPDSHEIHAVTATSCSIVLRAHLLGVPSNLTFWTIFETTTHIHQGTGTPSNASSPKKGPCNNIRTHAPTHTPGCNTGVWNHTLFVRSLLKLSYVRRRLPPGSQHSIIDGPLFSSVLDNPGSTPTDVLVSFFLLLCFLRFISTCGGESRT
ncbi:hypothetical protein LZ32DRAFT_292706 [Colletotrichum eremochloae]|nr:hypothetical protein LZ32DRAFT_292706 [Colletotrichum eremochloae]